MGEWFLKKLNVVASVLTIIVLFGLIIFATNIEIKDLDLWLHLATGRHIAETGIIPKVDILSGTISGAPWINHEWLFQVILHFLYNAFGPDGLISLQVVLVGLIFVLLLMLGYREKMQLVPLVSLVFVFMVFQLRFTHRPDLFSLMFFVVYFFILASQFESKISLFILFVVQILWNNIHGFFILGPMIILLGLFAEWMKRHVPLPYGWNQVGRLKDKEYLRLKYALGIVLLACVFNPHFIEGALYPFRIFLSVSGESKVFFKHIGELQKPITLSNLFAWQRFLYYKLLILFSALSFFINRKKIDIGLLLFWVFFLLFSLNANRNVVYFAVAAYFVIIANFQSILSFDLLKGFMEKSKAFSLGSIIIKVLLIVFMLQFGQGLSLRGYFDFDQNVRKSEYGGGISLRNFPYKAADFLIEQGAEGAFFNDFNSGAYLLGRCYPKVKVFIDGRTEVYGADYFESYRKAYDGDQEELQKILGQYPLTGAFLGSVYSPPSSNTLKYFYESDDWSLVYFDYDATIFLKNIPENQSIVNLHKVDLSQVSVAPADLTKIGVNRVTPYRRLNRAKVCLSLGFEKKARAEAEQAIIISPYYSDAFEILAKIDFANKDFHQALINYRKVKLLGENTGSVAGKLAQCFYRIGAYARAKEQCQKVLERKKNATAFYLLALISLQEEEIEDAYQFAMRGYETSPKANELLTEVGVTLFDMQSYEKAKNILKTVISLEEDEAVIAELQNKMNLSIEALMKQ